MFFGDYWTELEEIAITIGLDLHYFWSLNPIQYSKHLKVYEQSQKNKIDEYDAIAHLLGNYLISAIHEPSKYPKYPYRSKNNEIVDEMMSDDDMEKIARRNTIRLGGEIKE